MDSIRTAKSVGKFGTATAIAFGGGVVTGKQMSTQTVTIKPPPHDFYMDNDVSRFKIAEQLQAAGVVILIDEVEAVDDEVFE